MADSPNTPFGNLVCVYGDGRLVAFQTTTACTELPNLASDSVSLYYAVLYPASVTICPFTDATEVGDGIHSFAFAGAISFDNVVTSSDGGKHADRARAALVAICAVVAVTLLVAAGVVLYKRRAHAR